MAHKKHAKTPEQRLAEALVPRKEQPYAVPDNWCWVRAASICTFIGGGTPDKSNPSYWGGDIPWASIKDIKGDHLSGTVDSITEEGFNNSAANMCMSGDLILATRINPGDTIISDVDVAVNQDLKIVKSTIASDYLHLSFKVMKPTLAQKASGSTVKGIKLADVKALPIPFPPLAEQRRIVERVEGLFAKLDRAEFELQHAIEGSAKRKDSILYDAFNTPSEEDWNIVTVSQVVDSLKYGTSEKSSYENEGMAVLRIPNIGNEGIDFADMKYLSHRDVKKDDLLQENDILMIRSNGSRDLVGRCGIVPRLADKYTYASFLIRVRPSDDVYPAYLWRFLQSPQAREQLFNRAKSSSGIHNINSKEIGQTRMPLPPLDTQKAIVNRLDASLAREGIVVHIMRETLMYIQNIRTKVLAKALQGKLGTNNEGDSHAREELLSMFRAITING